MPIIDTEGKEIEPPTDEWARFGCIEEAKMAVRRALKRQKSSRLVPTVEPLDSGTNGGTTYPENTAASCAQKPSEIGKVTGPPLEPLSTSRNHSLLQQYATVEAGPARYVLSADPRAMEQFSFVGRGRYRIGNVIPFNAKAA
jgi:hypothetical protein